MMDVRDLCGRLASLLASVPIGFPAEGGSPTSMTSGQLSNSTKRKRVWSRP